MRFKILALTALISSPMQSVQAANNEHGPLTAESMPIAVAGVCLSLAITFFGLWFVNRSKTNKVKTSTSLDDFIKSE